MDGQNTSCKAHKVCISVWSMGWDDVRTRADRVDILNWQVKRFGSTVLWYNFLPTSKHIEKKLYTDIDKYTHARTIGQGSTGKCRRYRRRRPPSGFRPLPVTKVNTEISVKY